MIDPRYFTVAGSFVVQAVMIGGFFAYALFFTQLEQEFGWSRTLLSAANSCVVIIMGTVAIGAGRLNDRYGPRGIMLTAGVLYALGWFALYVLSAPWQLFAFFALCMGIGLSAHDVVTLSVVAKIFARRRGMMSGLVKVGTATGQIAIPLVASALILAFGWRNAAVSLGVASMILLIIAALQLDKGLKYIVDHPPQLPPGQRADDGMEFRVASRSRVFVTLCLIQLCFFPTLVTIPLHLPVYGTDLGLSMAGAATLLSTVATASIIGRLAVGSASDRIGGRYALMACLTVLTSSLVFLNFANAPWMLYVFAVVYGIGHGGLFTVVSPTVAEYFGMRAHGSLFGIILFCGTVGAAFGPIVAGRAFDVSGSYSVAFWMLAALAFTGLMLVVSLPRSQPAPS